MTVCLAKRDEAQAFYLSKLSLEEQQRRLAQFILAGRFDPKDRVRKANIRRFLGEFSELRN